MHCIILAHDTDTFPQVLLPIKGRAVIDYLIDDILLQKDIKTISVIINQQSFYLIDKHLKSAYPNNIIHVVISLTMSTAISEEDDIMILQGTIFTSLKLQDFIRYYKQFKTITKAAYDKQSPKNIPFYIIPRNDVGNIDHLPTDRDIHTYNCGTGYASYLTNSTSF